MSIELTAKGSGYFRVYVDGTEVSKHTTEREAIEAATKQEQEDPGRLVEYRHDAVVTVVDDAVGVAVTDGTRLRLLSDDPVVVFEGELTVRVSGPFEAAKLRLEVVD